MVCEIYRNSQWVTLNVEKLPSLVKAHDTTNDTFSCVLKANTRDLPIEPMTPFRITNDDDSVDLMWVLNDSVSVFSLNPKTYKHSLTIVQYRYFLNKHLVRNTVFNQPRKTIQKLYLAASNQIEKRADDYQFKAFTTGTYLNIWYDPIIMNSHTKVKNATINMKLYGVRLTKADQRYELIQIQKLSELTFLNTRLKSDVKIVLVDTTEEPSITELLTIDIEDYFNNTQVSQDIIDTINWHMRSHTRAKLGLFLKVNGTNHDSGTYGAWDLAFAEAIDDTQNPSSSSYDALLNITIQVDIEIELYNYTMYDVIKTLRDQYRLTYYKNSTVKSKRDMLFYMPIADTDGLYELLTETYIPDTMNFTQCTWYEALTEVFRFFDAGFKFDENRRLQIEYYNDYEEDRTSDLKYTGRTMSHSDKGYSNGKVSYYQNAIQKVKAYHINTRSSMFGVPQDTEYDLVLPKPIYDIEKLTIKILQTSARTDAVEIFKSATLMDVDLDLTRFVLNNELQSSLPKEWDTITVYGGSELKQENTLPFERNSNIIHLSTSYQAAFNIKRYMLENVIRQAWLRFLGIPGETAEVTVGYISKNYAEQYFNVEYTSEVNGRAEFQSIIPKYKGEELVNQSDSFVDLNKLGMNILGETLKDGEPTLVATCQFTDWENRPKEGQYIIYNGSRWIINVANYSVLKSGEYQCTVEFSKNFNALSLRIQSDKEKRLTSISKEKAVISEDNFVDYVYVDDESANIGGESIGLDISNIEEMLYCTFRQKNGVYTKIQTIPNRTWDSVSYDGSLYEYVGSVSVDVDGTPDSIIDISAKFYDPDTHTESQDVALLTITKYAIISGTRINVLGLLRNYPDGQDVEIQIKYEQYHYNPNTIDVATITNDNIQDDNLYIPMIKYGFGNSICFELQMNDAISAGNDLLVSADWVPGVIVYFSEAVPYTDNDGWMDKVDIKFYTIAAAGKTYGIGRYPRLETQKTIDGNDADLLYELGSIEDLEYYKKPNEIFAFNYQWCFLPFDKDNFFIGSKFVNENGVTAYEKIKGKTFKLRYSVSGNKYAIMDTKGQGEGESDVSFDITDSANNKVKLRIITPTTITASSSWAIVDENNDIYFASNNAATFTNDESTTKFITFTTRPNRI